MAAYLRTPILFLLHAGGLSLLWANGLAADDEIIVTATKIPRAQEEIAGTVTVISDEDIERQMTTDLNELVDYLPGVSMNTAERGGNQGFIIRGIGGNRVLTLIDGVRANDIYGAGPSSYGRDFYDVDDLRGMEIIHGPASVLYGADALGGVVLLKSKQPRDYVEAGENTFLRMRAGSDSANDLLKTGLSGGWVGNRVETLVQYTNRQYSERDVNGAGELNPQDGESDNVLVKTIFKAADNHELSVTLDAFREELETELGASAAGLDESERFRAGFRHLWAAKSVLADSVDTQVYWQKTDALQHTDETRLSYSFINPVNPATFGGTQARRITDFEFNQEHLGFDSALSKSFITGGVSHFSVYGVQWDRTETERPRERCEEALGSGAVTCAIAAYPFAPPEVFPNKTFPDTETTRGGLFWQNEMTFGNSGLALIPGLRYDRYEMEPTGEDLLQTSGYGYEVEAVEEDGLSFNFGAIYSLSENMSLFTQYAEGFRPPNYDEANQAFVNLGFGYATVPNPDLKPEYSTGVELGIKTHFDRGALNFVVYRNEYTDFIESEFVGINSGIQLFQDRNIGEAEISGAELSSWWQVAERWRVRAAVAYARGDNEETEQPLDSVEPFTSVVGLAYSGTDDRWGLESNLTWVAEKDRVSTNTKVTADSYKVLDLTAYFNVTDKLSLRAGMFNLLDEEYARWANIEGLEESNAEAINKARAPGRSFRLHVNYQL